MPKTIIGFSITEKLKGNLEEELTDAQLELIDSKGNQIEPGQKVLNYNESYTIKATPISTYTIQSIIINDKSFNNGDSFIYKPGVFPLDNLNIKIICKAADLTKPVVTITQIDEDNFHWEATNNKDIVAHAYTNLNIEPTDWVEDTTTEENVQIDKAGTTYIWVKDNSNNIGVSSIVAYGFELNLTNCSLSNSKPYTLNNFYKSNLNVNDNYYLDDISITMDGKDITKEVLELYPGETDPSLFEFNNNIVTKYLGEDKEVVVPKSYSVVKTIPINYADINYDFLIGLRYASNLIITDGTTTKTYATGYEAYNNLNVDFPSNAKLISCDFTQTQVWYYSALTNSLVYPVYYDNVKYDTYNLLYAKWRTDSPTQIEFKGNQEEYGRGKDIVVDTLDSNCFRNNLNIEKVTLLDNIINLGESYSFAYCSNLKEIVMYGEIKTIPAYAFYSCSNLIKLNLPDNTLNIFNNAFDGCSSLEFLYIPKNVIDISSSAFNGCINLHEIIVDEENTKYDSRNSCNAIIETETNTLILGCKDTVMQDTIKIIGANAFYGNTNLTNISISNSVERIDNWAFCGTGLTSLTIPLTVKWIGIRFIYNSNITDLNFINSYLYKTNNSSNWENRTGGSYTYVSSGSTSANYFKSNSNYYSYYWYRN